MIFLLLKQEVMEMAVLLCLFSAPHIAVALHDSSLYGIIAFVKEMT